MSISNKKRFAIFERDGFTCQYCGKKPPEVVLEVDHMVSKNDGGRDDAINLITSCFACNRGKSATSVSIATLKGKAVKREVKLLKDKKIQLRAYYEYLRRNDELLEMTIDEL